MAVLTTYNIDPLFFERVVLYDLAAGGTTRIFVLADSGQAMLLIASARTVAGSWKTLPTDPRADEGRISSKGVRSHRS
jgi:hypothetical protein